MATSKTAHVLANKKVVIIGGSSGIGFAAASALIEEGASVVIGSSSSDRVAAAVQRLSDPAQQYNADASRVSGHAVNLKVPQPKLTSKSSLVRSALLITSSTRLATASLASLSPTSAMRRS